MHFEVEFSLSLTGQTRTRGRERRKKKNRNKAIVPKGKKLAQTGKGSSWIAFGESSKALNKPAGGNEGFKWHANGLPLKESVKRQQTAVNMANKPPTEAREHKETANEALSPAIDI